MSAATNGRNGIARALLAPVMQYGFAGFAALLIGVVVWQMNLNNQQFDRLLEIQRESTTVIEGNTSAIKDLGRIVHEKL